MSLATDSIFVAAISSNSDLMDRIGSRLYSTAIPLPDEDADNVPVPYIIVTFDGLNNEQTTKDDPFESENDSVSIGIECAAPNRATLAELMQDIRTTVHDYMIEQSSSDDFVIEDYRLSADAVQYDSLKPCFWQTIRYQCDVINLNEEDNGEEGSQATTK